MRTNVGVDPTFVNALPSAVPFQHNCRHSGGCTIETLYPVAYKLKFSSKLTLDQDYVVPPLEALWWAQDMAVFTTKFDQSQWDWTAMIMVPPWISKAMHNTAVKEVTAKKSPPNIDLLKLESLAEGKCVQRLHLGP